MGKNVGKRKFFCDFIEIAQLVEAGFMGGFQVTEFESAMIITMRPFLVL